jgi:hypothetical protein
MKESEEFKSPTVKATSNHPNPCPEVGLVRRNKPTAIDASSSITGEKQMTKPMKRRR